MPSVLTAADFSGLHLQYKSAIQPGELYCVIEHDFPDGRMVDHYFVTPSARFMEDPAIQDLEGITGILFLQQQPVGTPWRVLVHESTMIKEVVFEMEEAEFRAMLAASNITLPGES